MARSWKLNDLANMACKHIVIGLLFSTTIFTEQDSAALLIEPDSSIEYNPSNTIEPGVCEHHRM